MPETIAIPSLPSPSPAAGIPAARPAAAGGTAPDKTAASSAPADAGAGGNSVAASGKDAPAFAVVLQRQIAQSMPKAGLTPVAIVAAATAKKAVEDDTSAQGPATDDLALVLSMVPPGKPGASAKTPEKKSDAATELALQLATAAVVTPTAVPVTPTAVPVTPTAEPVVTSTASSAAKAVREKTKPQSDEIAQALLGATGTAGKPGGGSTVATNLSSGSAAQGIGEGNAEKAQAAAISAALPPLSGEVKADHAAAPKAAFDNLLAAAQATMQAQGTGSRASAAPPLKLETPVATQGWDAELGDKLVWMVGQNQQRAELVLNPPELGRIEVTLSISGHHADASFSSANPAVRDALEAALPRLRETFADAGVSLGQTHVGSGSADQYTNKQENGDNSGRSSGDFVSGTSAPRQVGAAAPWLRRGNGLVDVFA